MKYTLGIVSFSDDIHAMAIAHHLKKKYHLQCCVFEFDTVAGNESLSIRFQDNCPPKYRIRAKESSINPSDLSLIWWRRTKKKQIGIDSLGDISEQELVNNDCYHSLFGALTTSFSGIWISDPWATQKAANKVLQLEIASKSGFRIPKTLISQNPNEIKLFYEELSGNVVVKPFKGTDSKILYTRLLKKDDFKSIDSLRTVPAIFQEEIKGEIHLRIFVYGDNFRAAEIQAKELDWRRNLNIPFKEVGIDNDIKEKISSLLSRLNLKMGVIDIKVAEGGEPVWLEINPQGQFLFVEGITKMKLIESFSEWLYSEHNIANK